MEDFFLSIRDILVIPLILVIAGIALMRGIKGRFMDMIIILAIGVVGLVVLYSPEILAQLAQDVGSEVGGV